MKDERGGIMVEIFSPPKPQKFNDVNINNKKVVHV